jgi:hypothetical protein
MPFSTHNRHKHRQPLSAPIPMVVSTKRNSASLARTLGPAAPRNAFQGGRFCSLTHTPTVGQCLARSGAAPFTHLPAGSLLPFGVPPLLNSSFPARAQTLLCKCQNVRLFAPPHPPPNRPLPTVLFLGSALGSQQGRGNAPYNPIYHTHIHTWASSSFIRGHLFSYRHLVPAARAGKQFITRRGGESTVFSTHNTRTRGPAYAALLGPGPGGGSMASTPLALVPLARP